MINQFAASATTPRTEAEVAIAALRDLMDDGKLQPGDRLPPERELTSRLNVTRTTLRKALEEMERSGEIWRHVGKGTFVAAGVAKSAPLDLAHLSQTVTPMHMMRARLSLEPAIAREAAINASGDKLAAIRAEHQRAIDAKSWDDYEAADDALHRAIADATSNQLLLALFRSAKSGSALGRMGCGHSKLGQTTGNTRKLCAARTHRACDRNTRRSKRT